MENMYTAVEKVETFYKINQEALKVGQVIGFKMNDPVQKGTEVLDVYSDGIGVVERIWEDRIEVFNMVTGIHSTLWAKSFEWRNLELLSDVEHLLEVYKNELC